MTPRCATCAGPLFACDLLNNLTTCVECARRALRASRSPSPRRNPAPAPVAPALGGVTPEEWAIFTAALAQVARGGEVHQRHMRPLLRGRITPHQHIASCYSRAIAVGLIREVRRERSNDVIGRNTNKDEPVYSYHPETRAVA